MARYGPIGCMHCGAENYIKASNRKQMGRLAKFEIDDLDAHGGYGPCKIVSLYCRRCNAAYIRSVTVYPNQDMALVLADLLWNRYCGEKGTGRGAGANRMPKNIHEHGSVGLLSRLTRLLRGK